MCESSVFLDEEGEVREIMADVTRIVMDNDTVTCTNIVGERTVLEGVRFKEANLLSHGFVFHRI